MYTQNICRKDCMHRENGVCKYGYHIQNSIFHVDQKKCIYYASNIKKDASNDLFPRFLSL